jgi:hypothetical protein
MNRHDAPRLGSLSHTTKTKCVPLEIADNLAYDAMKEILNQKYDPNGKRRTVMERKVVSPLGIEPYQDDR